MDCEDWRWTELMNIVPPGGAFSLVTLNVRVLLREYFNKLTSIAILTSVNRSKFLGRRR